MLEKNQYVATLTDKSNVQSIFLVKYSSLQTGKTGKAYLNLVLMDKTGELEARVWDDVPQVASMAVRDAFVWVEGACQNFQGRKQIVVKKLQGLREDQVKIKDYLKVGEFDSEEQYKELVEFVHSMKDPYYKALAESILIDDEEIVSLMKKAPAAKTIHHAYRGGLLEHVVAITKTLDFLSQLYSPFVDRDLLFLGGFLHDLAKIWELSFERSTDYTDAGRLLGHLVMGIELVEKKVIALEATPGKLSGKFPEEKKLLVKHMIASHHGSYEFGSPKEPQCLEAFIVHAIDDLDSKINSIRKFIEADTNPGKWTLLHKGMERFFYKPEWARQPTELNS